MAPFCVPFGSLSDSFGFLLTPFSSHWLPFGSHQHSFCFHCVPFRSTLLLQAPFRFVLGPPGGFWDPIWNPLRLKWQPKCSQSRPSGTKRPQKTSLRQARFLQAFWNIRPIFFWFWSRFGLPLGSNVSANPRQFGIRKRSLFEYCSSTWFRSSRLCWILARF